MDRQREFIVRNSDYIVPKYRYLRAQERLRNRKHAFNKKYSFTYCGKKERVCKTFFLATLSIGDSFLRNSFNYCDERGFVKSVTKSKSGAKSSRKTEY